MSIISDIFAYLNSYTRPRNVGAPTEEQALITYDGDGNERAIVKRSERRQNIFGLASVADFLHFVQDIAKRYANDLFNYRELVVKVDASDTPISVKIATPHDAKPIGSARFDLRDHEDFVRWFSGERMTQTEFRRMLIELEGQHDCDTLVKILGYIEYKTEITFEASAETERNYVIGYKEKDNSKAGFNIPKVINVECPVVSGAAYMTKVAFDIVIRRPKVEDPQILFTLVPAGKSALKIRRDARQTIVKEELLEPALKILADAGVITVTPLYVRDDVKVDAYDPASDNFTL